MPLYLGNIVKQGSVGYTKVGSPTIVDGVASGFSENDYLISSSLTSETDITKYEIFTKFKVNSFADVTRGVITYRAGSIEGIYVRNTNKIVWAISRRQNTTTDITAESSVQLNLNTDYIVWCHYLGDNVFALDVSVDNGNTWIRDTKATNVAELSPLSTDWNINIGGSQLHPTAKQVFTNGSIDLNRTYIKVNDDAWFGPCKMFDAGKYNFKI